jgi:hypothetical protein
METESDGTIPFLDVLVIRKEPALTTKICRKPTHTGCYLHFDSNHPPHVGAAIILPEDGNRSSFRNIVFLKKH